MAARRKRALLLRARPWDHVHLGQHLADIRVREAEIAVQGTCLLVSGTPGGLASISRDGQRFALVVPPPPPLRQITALDRQGKVVRRIGEPGLYDLPALSPDGTRVAVVRNDPLTNNVDIWSFDMKTGKGIAITNDEDQDITPIWSPDGKQILYVSIPARNGTQWSINRKAADGSGTAEQLFRFTPGASMQLTDISADGMYVGFSSGGALYVIALTGTEPLARKATEYLRDEYNDFLGRFSPDSRFVAYVSDESDRNQVWVRPFDSASGTPHSEGKWRVSKDGGDSMVSYKQEVGPWTQYLSAMKYPRNGALIVLLSRRSFRLN